MVHVEKRNVMREPSKKEAAEAGETEKHPLPSKVQISSFGM
jgi:hypothetical protein